MRAKHIILYPPKMLNPHYIVLVKVMQSWLSRVLGVSVFKVET